MTHSDDRRSSLDAVAFSALALARGARPEELEGLLAALWDQAYPVSPMAAVAQMDQALRMVRRGARNGHGRSCYAVGADDSSDDKSAPDTSPYASGRPETECG